LDDTSGFKRRSELYGRRVLTATPPCSSVQDVARILNEVLPLHRENSRDIDYLYGYYLGKQPAAYREKSIRPEINNRLVENRAFEIVEFKKGYEFSHPVIYTNVGLEDSAPVDKLNEYARLDKNDSKANELSEWFFICGTSYKICQPNPGNSPDEAPYFTAVLDPRYAFVVYSNDVFGRPLLACKYIKQSRVDEKGKITEKWVYSVYTDTNYLLWTLDEQGADFTKTEPDRPVTTLRMIPIVEYPLNPSRIGYIEVCIPIFDAINTVGCNRIDGIEQFVQALLVLINCELPTVLDDKGRPVIVNGQPVKVMPQTGDVLDFKSIPGAPASAQYLTAQLDQSQTQTAKEDLLNAMYEICGVPSRNDRAGGGDTGEAVVLRDGWGAAEARAKSTEKMFRQSELEYLKIVLRICRDTRVSASMIGGLTLGSVGVELTRNRSDNMMVKANVLKILLDCSVDPEDAFEVCELFSDPVATWKKSRAWGELHEMTAADTVKVISAMLADEYVDKTWAVRNNPLIGDADKGAIISILGLEDQRTARDVFTTAAP